MLRIAFYGASALVVALSLAPSATQPATSIGDKVEHVIAYAELGLLGTACSVRGVTRVILGAAPYDMVVD